MLVIEKKHKTNAVVVCDHCGKFTKNNFWLKTDLKMSHYLLLCEKCVNKVLNKDYLIEEVKEYG